MIKRITIYLIIITILIQLYVIVMQHFNIKKLENNIIEYQVETQVAIEMYHKWTVEPNHGVITNACIR